ncbi:MAG: hypothetical protein JRG91_16485 [Deltaproteobacteria bacterium]|nr:hypothetical protein [Deltaproteobacteria bacterium]
MKPLPALALTTALLLVAAGCGSAIKATGDAGNDTAGDPTPEITIDVIPDPTGEPTPDIGVDTSPGSGATGDSCVEDHECTGVPGEGRFCMNRIELGGGYFVDFPNGYCSAECGGASECGPGSDCVDFGYLGLCFKRCGSDGECRIAEGYVCYSIPYVTTETYCVPYM